MSYKILRLVNFMPVDLTMLGEFLQRTNNLSQVVSFGTDECCPIGTADGIVYTATGEFAGEYTNSLAEELKAVTRIMRGVVVRLECYGDIGSMPVCYYSRFSMLKKIAASFSDYSDSFFDSIAITYKPEVLL